MWSIETLLGVLHRAARGLRRAPAFTAAVVASLALGIGANTAVFALVQHALLRPLPYPDANALLAVGATNREGTLWATTGPDLDAWQRASRTLAALAWVRGSAAHAVIGTEDVSGARAAPNLLHVLGVRPLLGRWFTAEESRRRDPVVVVSQALWQRQLGGAPAAIGHARLRVDGRAFTVIGVLPSGVGYPTDAAFWYPDPDNLSVEVVARARAGVLRTAVQRELQALAPSVGGARRLGIPTDIVVVTLHERLYGANGPILRLLLGTVVVLFLLTCTNVANLALARTRERRRELAACVALGATRRRLAGQMLAEHVILAAAGGAVGAVLALWITGVLVRLSPAELPGVRGAHVGLGGILFATGAAMVAALAVSIAPALAVTRGDLRPALGQPGALGAFGARHGPAGRARAGLVVAQLAIALLLLTGSSLLIRSMARLTRIDTGFDRRGLVLARLSLVGARYDTVAARRLLVENLLARLSALPGVRSVAIGPPPLVGRRGPSFTDGYDNLFGVRDSTAPDAPFRNVWVKYVDGAYLETFQIRAREGRGITAADDAGAPAVALVNTAAARLLVADGGFPGRPVGRRLDPVPAKMSGGRPITVVGVLPDVRQRDLTIPAAPEIWLPLSQHAGGYRDVSITVRTRGDAEHLTATVAQVVAALDPALRPRRITTMDAVVRETLAPQRYVLTAFGAFAALALGLAGLGLYAVMAYLTATRTREIGIRLALGAQPAGVRWAVLRDGLRLTALGTAIGLPVALGASRVLAGFLYEVAPRDVPAFLLAPGVLTLVALLATYVPARRATQVNPVTALRAD